MPINRQITLAERPTGFPTEANFKLVETPTPEIEEGQILVKAEFLSVDPYMRGRMNDTASYADPVEIGSVMVGESVGRVLQSKNKKHAEGSYVSGMFGWQEYAVSDGKGIRRIDASLAPVSTSLHILGMPGLTAYFGLFDVCQVKSGETLLVSGAAGAVGSTVGQLAKEAGCRVVGVAGSDEKVEFLVNELGFDSAFNYKTTDDFYAALKEHCPDRIDAYFDNVGGPLTDAAFARLNQNARIAICGQISQYNLEKPEMGPRLLWNLIVQRGTVRGFLVFDYFDRFREGITALTESYLAGKLRYRERIQDGIENAPQAFFEMMQGANIGKQLVRIGEN